MLHPLTIIAALVFSLFFGMLPLFSGEGSNGSPSQVEGRAVAARPKAD